MVPYNFPHDITPCWGKLTSHHPCFKALGAWFKGARRRSKVQMLMDRLGLRRKAGNFASGVNHWTMEILHLVLVGGFNHLEKYEFVNGKDYPIYEMEKNKSLKQLEYHWTLWVMGFQWFIMWWYLMAHLVFVMGIISHLVWWCYVQWFSHASIFVGCTTMFTKGYVETSWKMLVTGEVLGWLEYMGFFENGQVSKLANHHD